MTTAMNLFHGPMAHALTQALGWTLLHFLWQGALVAVVLWCALALMERRSADARYAAACLALLSMVALPLLTFAHLAVDEYGAIMAQPVFTSTSSTVACTGATAGPTSWSAYLSSALDRMMPSLMLAWCAGVFVFLCRLAVGIAVAHGWKLQGIEHAPAQLQRVFDDLRVRLGVRNAARLVESARVHVPTVVGWLKPVVLLPVGCLAGMSEQQVEALLAHELAHVCRNDYLVSVVQSVLEAVLFYHPAVWWVSGQVRREREYCCDEMAVGVCGDRLAYARALSLLEERRALLPEVVLGANGGVLTMRIKRLLGYREEIASSNMAWVIVLAIVIAGGGSLIGRFAVAESKPASAAAAAKPSEQASESEHAAASAAQAQAQAADAEKQLDSAAHQAETMHTQLQQAQEALTKASSDQSTMSDADRKQLEAARQEVKEALKNLNTDQIRKQMDEVRRQVNSAEFRKQIQEATDAAKKVNSADIQKQMAQSRELQQKAEAEIQKQLNSPEFKKKMEDAQKQLQDSKELQQKIQAKLNSPEFRKQLEDAKKQAEKFNSPEFRQKMEAIQRQMQLQMQKFNSPEFKKQLEDAQKHAGEFNTPEFRQHLQDVQKQIQEQMQKFNSPEYREKLRKMVEDAQKNSAQLKFDSNSTIAQNAEPSPAQEPAANSVPERSRTTISTNTNVHVSGSVIAGQATSQPPPVYPQEAKEHHIEGTVVLKATIGKTGDVEHLSVISGPKELTRSAIDAVSQWKYKPYLMNGQPVEVETTINVNYSLADSSKPGDAQPTPTPGPSAIAAPAPIGRIAQASPANAVNDVRKVGPGIDAPVLVYKVDPQYTVEAKAAKVQGPVVVNLVVNQSGEPENVHVVRGLGHGLDVQAITAVQQYRFKPAVENGQAVPVSVNVEVQYRLR